MAIELTKSLNRFLEASKKMGEVQRKAREEREARKGGSSTGPAGT